MEFNRHEQYIIELYIYNRFIIKNIFIFDENNENLSIKIFNDRFYLWYVVKIQRSSWNNYHYYSHHRKIHAFIYDCLLCSWNIRNGNIL